MEDVEDMAISEKIITITETRNSRAAVAAEETTVTTTVETTVTVVVVAATRNLETIRSVFNRQSKENLYRAVKK
jgi:hypothetical protein